MLCWDSDMPDEVARAYAIWDSVAAGNVSETARLLDMRRPTVQDWSQRYRWKERQANQRAEDRDRTISHAWAKMAADLPNAIETVLAARASVYDKTGKPGPGTPTSIALKAAALELAVFGIAPVRTSAIAIATSDIGKRTSPAELDALLAATHDGNDDALASLLALAAGQLAPRSPLPQDFTSTQPGGRVVPGTRSPVREDAVSQAEGAGPIDTDYSVIDAAERPTVTGDGSA